MLQIISCDNVNELPDIHWNSIVRCFVDDTMDYTSPIILELEKKGAEIVLYEDDRVVEIEFLENILESHFDTESYLQETDDKFI